MLFRSVLYPNPASDELKAILPKGVNGMVNIQVFSQPGVKLLDYNTETFDGVSFTVDVKRLSPGIYSIVFTNSEKHTYCRGRFVIIK